MNAMTVCLEPRAVLEPRLASLALARPLEPDALRATDRVGATTLDRRPVRDPSTEQVQAALAAVLASATFRHSARHRSFLRYVVDQALAGRSRALKEVVIGLDVFRRSLDGFDPRRDSIVRVEARRLRGKLRDYYEGEGRDDPVRITLAVGGYVPGFEFPHRAGRAPGTAAVVRVVPFATLGDAQGVVVAAGLRDKLTDSLAAIAGTSVLAACDRSPVDGRQATVDADFVVDGSVTHIGDRWRCIAHLTSRCDGLRRWSRSFDFTAAGGGAGFGLDLFAMQDRIADAVCAAMRDAFEREH